MGEKLTNLTDLQRTMVCILYKNGVKLEDCSPASVTINDRSIGVRISESDNGWNSTKEWLVSVSPETQMILITNMEERSSFLGFGNDGSLGWFNHTTQMYQIVDGVMRLTTTVQQGESTRDFLGGRVDNLSTDTQTDFFELPEGYKITDGIDAFALQPPLKSK